MRKIQLSAVGAAACFTFVTGLSSFAPADERSAPTGPDDSGNQVERPLSTSGSSTGSVRELTSITPTEVTIITDIGEESFTLNDQTIYSVEWVV